MEEVRNPYAAPEAPVGQPMDACALARADRGMRLGAVAIFGDGKHCRRDMIADTIVADA